ncbi:MAG: phenylalanine ammonia-lyase [Acidobacteriaceae bacterium]|nr:phenylalanine ammonia-lyase [Acidobacteriaceae bacterium]MEA2261216.1 phenylalanine ammonia-lyase [Acidobacteriaceae bacterium]
MVAFSSDSIFGNTASEINADNMAQDRRTKPALLITPDPKISISEIRDVAVLHRPVSLDPQVLFVLARGRAQLERKLNAESVIYGVNTGFGGNADLVIPAEQMEAHQANLLTFLTAGTGDLLAEEYVRGAQLLTLLAIVRGWSGVRKEIAAALVNHLNHAIVPNVPRHGSVGASGDLIPSSYVASALCGRGRVRYKGKEVDASEALRRAGLSPIHLQAKEGLALVNGTRVMTGVAALTIFRFEATFRAAVGALALAVEALLASREHYDARIHAVKGHPGQIAVAAALREFLSVPPDQPKPGRGAHELREHAHAANRSQDVIRMERPVQEVYSIRCAPQVLGVAAESLQAARDVLAREAVSVNDNPLIDPDNGDILNGGNFMGQHVSRAMDGIKLDLVTVGNHMHSIMALLMDNRFSRGLPHSLSANLGVSQGFKGVQISQTALIAHLRQESAPASIHTLPTEQFNQDIVSLGLHAALGAADMEKKLRNAVAMTLLAACQAIDLRGMRRQLAAGTGMLYGAVRKLSPFLEQDLPMDRDIERLSRAIEEGSLPLPYVGLDSGVTAEYTEGHSYAERS